MYSGWIFSLIGWLILRLKYRTKKERLNVLNTKYDGMYRTVGAEYPLKFIGFILIILLIVFILAIVYSIFKHGPAPV